MKYAIFIFLVLIISSCKKEQTTQQVSASVISDYQTDGTVTVEASILPPATQQTFIANGKTSKAVFQITARDSIIIDAIYFSGEYPLVQYIYAKNIGVAVNQPSGQMGLTAVGNVDKHGIKLTLDVHYDTVNVSTSGSIANLNITAIQYRTKSDDVYHSFTLPKTINALPVSVVNNVAHILLQKPDVHKLENGYQQIIKIQLTGGTSWKLKKLPLSLHSPFTRKIQKSQLIVKYEGEEIALSDTIKLDVNSRTETVINFGSGFQHKAGEVEILKIYAKTPYIGKPFNPIITDLNPLSSFVWADGLGVTLNGGKNNSYYKEETGQSVYDEY